MKLDNDDLEEIFNIDRYYSICPGEWVSGERTYNNCSYGKVWINKEVGLTPKGNPKHKSVEKDCDHCKGTGLYSGFGEQTGVAVVCSTCRGTGKVKFSYTPFTKRKGKHGIVKVFEGNKGYGIGRESMGGLTYAEWARGDSFFGKEQRDKICPHWHSYDFKIKGCDNLLLGSKFTDCPSFKNKATCWDIYDQTKGKGKK